MSRDDENNILSELKDFRNEVKPFLTLVTQHEVKIVAIEKSVNDYKDKQIPFCDKRFGKLYGLLWTIVVLLLVGSIAVIGNMIVVNTKIKNGQITQQ